MTNKVKNTKKSVMSKKVKMSEKQLVKIIDQYNELFSGEDNENERSSLMFLLCCGMDWNDIMNENEEYKDFIVFIKDKFYSTIEKKRSQFLELWDFNPSEMFEEQFYNDLGNGWLVNAIEDYMIDIEDYFFETYK